MSDADLRSMPKVLLHEHLDGGLRHQTLLDLLRARGTAAPADTPEGIAHWFSARAHAGSLVEYLRGFALTVDAMATLDALRRVAREAAADARADGCVLAEFRLAPLLFEPYGLAPDAVVEALLQGLADDPLPSGLILCAMRQEPPEHGLRVAKLAETWRDRGVVGFDIAGPEAGFPPSRLAEAIGHARDAGLGLTLHAGEADEGARVLEAIRLGATRIGHGVRLADYLGDAAHQDLLDEVRQHDVHLEVCPTSNVHTGAYASIEAHPIAALWHAGISLSFHTDNRLMSVTTATGEARCLLDQTDLTLADLVAMQREAARNCFLGEAARHAALLHIDSWTAAHAAPSG